MACVYATALPLCCGTLPTCVLIARDDPLSWLRVTAQIDVYLSEPLCSNVPVWRVY